MNPQRLRIALLIVMLLALVRTASAQDGGSIPPGEPDIQDLIQMSFVLQDFYNHVLCVSGDGACPASS